MELVLASGCNLTPAAQSYVLPPHAPLARPRAEVSALVLFIIFHFAGAFTIALIQPFPSVIDELQHLSYVQLMKEAPAIFPDYSTMLVLAEDMSGWTQTSNYLNHPPLYYLILAPLLNVSGGDLYALRLANVGLSTAALSLAALGSRRLLPTSEARILFYAVLFTLPKAAVLGGTINNDNLALLSGALLFIGLTRTERGGTWLAAALFIAGWTKLTALVMVGTATLAWRLWPVLISRQLVFSRTDVFLGTAGFLAALPYLHTACMTGGLLVVNDGQFYVPPDARLVLEPLQFLARFLRDLAAKWSALEGNVLGGAGAALILILFGTAVTEKASLRLVLLPVTAALAVGFVAHVSFGWAFYQRLGDLTVAQTRYYNVIWPSLAFGAALGTSVLPSKARTWVAGILTAANIAECLQPYLLAEGIARSFSALP